MPDFSNATDGSVLLEQAQRYFEDAERRHADVRDKAKSILTLVVFVASFIAFAAGFSERGWMLLIPAVFVLVAGWLFLEMFRLSWSGFPAMDQRLVDADDRERRRLLAEDYVRAARFGGSRTDYVATVLIAGRRAAASALISVLAVTIVYAAIGKQPNTEDAVIRQIDSGLPEARSVDGDRVDSGTRNARSVDINRVDSGSSSAPVLE